MARHTLSVYHISTRISYGAETVLGDIDGTGQTRLIDVLLGVFRNLGETGDNIIDNEDREKTLAVQGVLDLQPPDLGVVLELGDYGITSQFSDLDTQQAVFDRRQNHVETEPALAYFRLRPKRRTGLLVAHSPNGRGFKSDLSRFIRLGVRSQYDVTVNIGALTPGDAWHHLVEQGALKKIRWVKYRRPIDFAEEIDERMWEEDVGSFEVVKTSARGRAISRERIERFLDGDIEQHDLLRLEEVPDVEFDAIRASIVLPDGSQNTVNILSLEVPRMEHDITEALDWDDDGYPTIESLRREAEQLATSYEQGLGPN